MDQTKSNRKRNYSDENVEHSKNKYYKENDEKRLSIKDIQKSLPVYKCQSNLLKTIKNNQIVIITGDTGCGKSTQIPQYLFKDGYGLTGNIACTQPRRVGAISLANRVCDEIGCRLGEEVGYSIRFENCTSSITKIHYMTDGVLLRELQADPLLQCYSVIIIDEAHERTIQTDALFGILKCLTAKRQELKLIISSATLHADKFAHYFHNAAIFTIPGRLYKVKIKFAKKTEKDYIDEVVNKVMKIHTGKPLGDILVFLPGQEEIEACCNQIRKRNRNYSEIKHRPDLLILPAFSALAKKELSKIFAPTPRNCRKVVVATNIAETSLTIDGIVYVIDPGLVKQKVYNPQLGIDQLVTTDVSRAQGDQRAGRAGRVGRGVCYRLYTERHFEKKMLPYTIPEIQRANLSNTVLQLKSIGIHDVERFDFIDHPGRGRLSEAVRELEDLLALRPDGTLTPLGRCMSAFPLEPLLAKILIMSSYKGCAEELLTIVSMLCVQNVFERRPDPNADSQRRQTLLRPQGDHITLLYVYLCWREAGSDGGLWCEQHCVRSTSMKQAKNIRDQLADVMERCRLAVTSCGPTISLVQNTLALYYFRRNAARKEPGVGYRTLADDQLVHIHPTSALFERQPDWVVYHDIVITKEKYIREVTKINAHFLRELVPSTFQA